MYCKYCGIRLRENQNVLCSVCEALKDDMGKNSETFSYSREELADEKRKKPSVRRLIVSLMIAAVISYGAAFVSDMVEDAAEKKADLSNVISVVWQSGTEVL